MAYTSVIPVHRLDNSVAYVLDKAKTSRAQNAGSLQEAVDYALNRDKTERDLFETGLGCATQSAFVDMRKVKEVWHKLDGVQGFHLVQSFAPGEVTPELAHQIGLELADRLLGGKYQAVIGTHLNTGCIHNHIVWNSVAMDNGMKYHSSKKTYVLEVRGISDELCRKYGLSVIQTERSEQVAKPYILWQAQKRGEDWKAPIRQDVDAAIAGAFTWRQFLAALERKGYTLHFERRDPSLTPPGKEWRVRFKTLGPRYTPESIQRRILEPKAIPPAGTKPVRRAKLRAGGKPLFGRSSLRALYYVYLYRMGVLPRKPSYMGYEVRQDIRRLDRRIEQMTFLTKHGIDDRGQLAALQAQAESEIAALTKERKKLYRTAPQGERIEQINARLKTLRRTVKLCKDITVQSEEMERRMREDRQTAQRLKEEQARPVPGRKKRDRELM